MKGIVGDKIEEFIKFLQGQEVGEVEYAMNEIMNAFRKEFFREALAELTDMNEEGSE